jgi:hypothetical protein
VVVLCYTPHMFDRFTTLFDSPFFGILGQIYDLLVFTSFFWGPIIAVFVAKHLWLEYVQMEFIKKNFDFILLEVKLPRLIEKTPIAMELVLQALHQSGTGNWYERWWKGKVKPWFSLEIISVEGNVKFLIRTPSRFKKLIESHVYAQYPDVDLREIPDYVSLAPYLHEKDEWSLWGCEFALTKADPYPIKTYVDYGLDSAMVKEEQKSDPITSTIEFMGSIGRGQQIWMQILVQATGNRFKTSGKWFDMHDWKDEGKTLIKELQDKYAGDSGMKATKRQGELINAIERSISKLGFDCGIRALYIAKQESFDPANIAGVVGSLRQYGSQDLNGFKPAMTTGFDYPWQDYKGIREAKQKRLLYDAYVRRSYFYSPYKRKPFVLNTEELATIFHFPGGVAETPTFSRIESRRGEPPSNLPI